MHLIKLFQPFKYFCDLSNRTEGFHSSLSSRIDFEHTIGDITTVPLHCRSCRSAEDSWSHLNLNVNSLIIIGSYKLLRDFPSPICTLSLKSSNTISHKLQGATRCHIWDILPDLVGNGSLRREWRKTEKCLF